MAFLHFSEWKDLVVFSQEGPQPKPLYMDGQFKVVLAGLEAGQSIPEHAEGRSLYHFLVGTGIMQVDGEAVAVGPGSILVMPDGAVRGLQAQTRLVFLASRVSRSLIEQTAVEGV